MQARGLENLAALREAQADELAALGEANGAMKREARRLEDDLIALKRAILT